VSTEAGQAQAQLDTMVRWVEQHWRDMDVEQAHMELR
jgi:uncharacterized protein YbdZ (MbtH family)